MINTASIERLNATFRQRLALLARRCPSLARRTCTLANGMYVVGSVYNFCSPHLSLDPGQQITPAMAAGLTDHCWSYELLSFKVRRLNGSHQSDEGGHHEPYKVSLRGGAGTTVNCGATKRLTMEEKAHNAHSDPQHA